MKTCPKSIHFSLALATIPAAFLIGCGDDDSFTPVAKDRGYDYAFTSTKEFADYPCNDVREGREAVVGRAKDSYYCQFDERDSVYIWAGYEDTLTATGKEFVRKEESSSSRVSSSSEDEEDDSSSSRASSSSEDEEESSSSLSSSSYSSSSYRSSSSNNSSSSSAKSSSSYSSSSSSSSSLNSTLQDIKDTHFNPDITYGTMEDTRDHKTYRTVVVDGVTWMAENLNYEGHSIGQSNCYDDNTDNCELYGRLYSRDAVMNDSRCGYKKSCDLGEGPIQGICPDGWHIPTKAEVQSLLSFTSSAAALKTAVSTWITPGNDTYGLSFVGAGNWDSDDGFEDMYDYEVMWIYVASTYQYFLLISSSAEVWDYVSDEYYATVRCIKGEAAPVLSSSSSLSSSSVSSSSSKPIEPFLEAGTQFNSTTIYGTMTDSRDDKTYKTVEIDGKTWMAENLNYADNEIGESFCFNDEDRFCDVYGRLYSRDAAMNDAGCNKSICDLGDAPIQGVCPNGWHIPSTAEMEDLLSFAGNKALPLISAESWKGSIAAESNSLGLSLIGAGDYDSSKHFEHLGEDAFVWVYDEDIQTYLLIRSSDNHAAVFQYNSTQMYISVRCVKD